MGKIAKREDIRDLILDAVGGLLAAYGYGKMTMQDVARQVGIGKGTIYLHFPSKEELVLAHIDRIAEADGSEGRSAGACTRQRPSATVTVHASSSRTW